MASMMPKQLGEFLQQQQEPFILEVYLLERGYQSQKTKIHPGCGSTMPAICLKRSATKGPKRNRKFLPNCSKTVKALFSRLLVVNNDQKIQNSRSRDQNSSVSQIEKRRQEIADEDNFSSASSTTVFNSCSESDVEDANYSSQGGGISSTAGHFQVSKDAYILIENEVAAGWKFGRRGAEDGKQLSPVSVLEDTASEEGSPVCKKREARRTEEQLLASVSTCKSEKPTYSRRRQEFVGCNASSQYSKNKKAAQQTKQLLFDCVREVVEKRKKVSGGQQFQEILGAEQLWELICENLWLWSKESINETNITRLLHFDALDSAQEWKYFKQQTQEMGKQIGDTILEDISSEIIRDIINIFS